MINAFVEEDWPVRVRPFHFAVLFWGEHYREHYFVDKFLRSMMAPGNLPLLDAKDGHKLVVACPHHDWIRLLENEIFLRACGHVNPRHVEIDYPDPGPDDNIRTKAILHQHKWMNVLLKQTHDPNAYGSVWSPDCMVSMRLVERMFMWRGHYDCVICPVLRQAEEPLLEEIGDKREFTPRQAAGLSIRHLHREMEPFIEPVHQRLTHAPYRLRPMPDGGLLIHGFFGLPVFMDYGVVSSDYRAGNIDTCLRTGNFVACENIHIVADSDEVSVISLTPKDFKNYQEFPDEPFSAYRHFSNIRTAWRFFGDDKVRRQMFRTPVRWHEFPITEEWREKERAIERGLSWTTSDGLFPRLAFDLPKFIRHEVAPRVKKVATTFWQDQM
jgi:hypothetical protein